MNDRNECNALAHSTVIVTSTCAQGTIPRATGGTIVEGTYVLTAQTLYGPSCSPDPDVLAVTLAYHGGVLDQVIDLDPRCALDAGAGMSTRSTATLSNEGVTLTATETCDSAGELRPFSDDYTATPTTLILQGEYFSRTFTLAP